MRLGQILPLLEMRQVRHSPDVPENTARGSLDHCTTMEDGEAAGFD